MTRVRVLLAGMPRMLRDIVEAALLSQRDLDVVGAADGAPAALRAALTANAAEVAIVGVASDAAVTMYDDVLYAHPRLRLLALVGDGRDALLYELRPNRTVLGEPSADVLLGAVRGA